MPTSSQALIVIAGEGEDPNVPRRHYLSTVPRKDIDLRTSMVYKWSGFPEMAEGGGCSGKMFYGNKNVDQTPFVEDELSANTTFTNPTLTAIELEEQEKKQARLERLGFRKRRTACRGPKLSESTCGVISSIPKEANFMPTPPGAMQCPLPPIVIPSVNDMICGDGMAINDQQHKCQTEKPKSLLEELKETVSYNNRVLPSMEMRKSLPLPSPNTVVFSLRNNEEYTHQDIMDLIKHETGFRALSVQYDPLKFRVGSSDVASRWFVQFGSSDETEFIVQNGFQINGDKVIVRLLDSVLKIEFEAYRLKMEDELTAKAKEPMAFLQRRTKMNGAFVKQTPAPKL